MSLGLIMNLMVFGTGLACIALGIHVLGAIATAKWAVRRPREDLSAWAGYAENVAAGWESRFGVRLLGVGWFLLAAGLVFNV